MTPLFCFIYTFQHQLLGCRHSTPHHINRSSHIVNISIPSNLHRDCGKTDLNAGRHRQFYPRTDTWGEHFEFEDVRIVGQTPIGHATVEVLAMNAEDLLLFRQELFREGENLTADPE